ncbi:MAG: cyclic nucleotide-binding domain-containing protein, partial [Pseudomonadales bacterium]|nr:cyclic nucleotide-binding domain-containing protein [Pseudomonadales bacterium]
SVYKDISDHSKKLIEDFAEQFPEFVETMQEQLGQRLMLIAERDSVKHSADLGIVPSGIASKILKDQGERIRTLTKDNMTAYFEIDVDELLRKVSVFAEVDVAHYPLIAKYLRSRSFATGTDIIKQGQSGDSMFLIARGIANVSVLEGGKSKQVAVLYAGDIFGESALLHQSPRNATATAATPCSFYELKRADLDKICAEHPEIRESVEKVDAERQKENATA